MTGAIFLLGAALFGIGLVRRLFARKLSHGEQLLWGIVVGWSISTVAAYGLVRAAGGFSRNIPIIMCVLVWLAASFSCLAAYRMERTPLFVWEKAYTPLLVVFAIFAPIYLHLFLTHMLQPGGDGGIYSGGESTFYDMAYHAAITNSFRYGANFPPIYTPMPPAPLLYPYLPDFFTALLMTMGMTLHSALVSTAFPLTLALTGNLFFLALRLGRLLPEFTEKRAAWAAAIATALFLLNGGIGFIYFFQDYSSQAGSFWYFVTHLEANYSHLPSKGLVSPNVVTDMLLPQRTSIFGLSLGFVILTGFSLVWTEAEAPWKGWQLLLFSGVLAGVLPLFHVHSWLAIGFISAVLFLLRPRRVWVIFWLPALALALPRLLDFSGHLGPGFIRFQPGWRGHAESSWPMFWIRNVGLPTLLILPAWFTAPRSVRTFYLPFLALLAGALLFVISPNDYDNLKLIIYWYAATAIVVAIWLCRLARHPLGWTFAGVCLVASTFSGALAILAESRSSRLMFGPHEVDAAEFVKANTTPHALFLTAPSLHQPVLSLAGRAIVRGPTAWLWSHGYPFARREADVRAMYAGRADAHELLRYYGVDYVYLGPRESEEVRANRNFFDAAFPAVYRADDIAIYDTRSVGQHDGVSRSTYSPRDYSERIDRDPSELLEEFSEVACRLYCIHKTVFGARPRYADFMADLARLGRGLYLGGPGWRETLENNKRELCNELLQRPAVQQRYSGRSAADFTAALVANAGLPLSEKPPPSETRSVILLRISSDPALAKREYNSAFVLCHYFAFLKRNPDDAPDRDLTGYSYWRDQLDQTRDYLGLTRAFLEADEYKRREL